MTYPQSQHAKDERIVHALSTKYDVTYLMPLKRWHVTFDTSVFIMIAVWCTPASVLAERDALFRPPTEDFIKHDLERNNAIEKFVWYSH